MDPGPGLIQARSSINSVAASIRRGQLAPHDIDLMVIRRSGTRTGLWRGFGNRSRGGGALDEIRDAQHEIDSGQSVGADGLREKYLQK